MNEMIKRKKDGGFTLIELMIVIAVIGILAVVLVPKVGTIKTQAKSAGIDTNIRMVQGYVQSRITSWNNSATVPTGAIVSADISNAFSVVTNPNVQDQITNPFNNARKGSATGTVAVSPANAALYAVNGIVGANVTTRNATTTAGTIVVSPVIAGGAVTSVVIFAHDAAGAQILDKTVTITP